MEVFKGMRGFVKSRYIEGMGEKIKPATKKYKRKLRRNLFSLRVIRIWNSASYGIIEVNNKDVFKEKLGKHMREKGIEVLLLVFDKVR